MTLFLQITVPKDGNIFTNQICNFVGLFTVLVLLYN